MEGIGNVDETIGSCDENEERAEEDDKEDDEDDEDDEGDDDDDDTGAFSSERSRFNPARTLVGALTTTRRFGCVREYKGSWEASSDI